MESEGEGGVEAQERRNGTRRTPLGDVVERKVKKTDPPKQSSHGPFPKAKHRSMAKGKEANIRGGATKSQPLSLGKAEVSEERSKDHFGKDNQETLRHMSEEQIQSMKEEICSRLPPEHIKMLQTRTTGQEEDRVKHQRLHERTGDEAGAPAHLPNVGTEAKGGPGSLKFDAKGNLCETNLTNSDWDRTTGTTEASVTGSVTRDILRAQMDPGSHTYTMVELAHLLRSSVLQQRVLSLRILAQVFEMAHPSTRSASTPKGTSWAEVWAFLLKDIQIVDLLRLMLDDEHAPVVTAAAKCIESLVCPPGESALLNATSRFRGTHRWEPLAPLQRDAPGCAWKATTQEARGNIENSEDTQMLQDQLDPLRALVRRDLLPRLRYLLHVYRPPGSAPTLLRILCAVARHSPDLCEDVMQCPHMLECLQELEASAEDPVISTAVLDLLKLLCRGSRACTRELLQKGVLSHLLRHTMLESSRGNHLHTCVYDVWAQAAAYGFELINNDHLFQVVQKDLVLASEDVADEQLEACTAVFCMLEEMATVFRNKEEWDDRVNCASLKGNLTMAAEHACLWFQDECSQIVYEPGTKPLYLLAFASVCRFMALVLDDSSAVDDSQVVLAGSLSRRLDDIRKIVGKSFSEKIPANEEGLFLLIEQSFGQQAVDSCSKGEALTECAVASSVCLHATLSLLNVLKGFDDVLELLQKALLQAFTASNLLCPDSSFSMVMWTPPVAAYEQMRNQQVLLLSDIALALQRDPGTSKQGQGGISSALDRERRVLEQEGLLTCLVCMVRPGEETSAQHLLRAFFCEQALHRMFECGHSKLQQFAASDCTATKLALEGSTEGGSQQIQDIMPQHFLQSDTSLQRTSANLIKLYEYLFLGEHSSNIDTLLLPAEGSCLPLGFTWFLEPFKRVDELLFVEEEAGIKVSESDLCAMLLIHMALESSSNCSLQYVPGAEKLGFLAFLFASQQDLFRIDAVRVVIAALLDTYTMDSSTENSQDLRKHRQDSSSPTSQSQTTGDSRQDFWLMATEVTSLVEHYCAVSFGDKLFGRFLAYHMQRRAPTSVRISVWQVLVNNRALHLLPKLSECAGSGYDYLALPDTFDVRNPAGQAKDQDELMLLELFVDILGDLDLFKLSIEEMDSPITLWIILYQLSAYFFGEGFAARRGDGQLTQTASSTTLSSRQCLLRRAIQEWNEHAWNVVLHFPLQPSFSPHIDCEQACQSSWGMAGREQKRDLLLQACQECNDLKGKLSLLGI